MYTKAAIKKYSRYSKTNELTKKISQYQRLTFVDLLFMARSINEKNDLEFTRYNQMFENDTNFTNFLKKALVIKKEFNKRFTNKRYLK